MLYKRISANFGPYREFSGLFNQKRRYFTHYKLLHASQICSNPYRPALECPSKFKSKGKSISALAYKKVFRLKKKLTFLLKAFKMTDFDFSLVSLG